MLLTSEKPHNITLFCICYKGGKTSDKEHKKILLGMFQPTLPGVKSTSHPLLACSVITLKLTSLHFILA
jgi:hypothetical protein